MVSIYICIRVHVNVCMYIYIYIYVHIHKFIFEHKNIIHIYILHFVILLVYGLVFGICTYIYVYVNVFTENDHTSFWNRVNVGLGGSRCGVIYMYTLMYKY